MKQIKFVTNAKDGLATYLYELSSSIGKPLSREVSQKILFVFFLLSFGGLYVNHANAYNSSANAVAKKHHLSGELTSVETLKTADAFLLQNEAGELIYIPSGWDMKTASPADAVKGEAYCYKCISETNGTLIQVLTKDLQPHSIGWLAATEPYGTTTFINRQPAGQNVVFGLGLNNKFGQDGDNLALWTISYDSEKGFAFESVGVKGSYLSSANGAACPSEEIVYWRAYTGFEEVNAEQTETPAQLIAQWTVPAPSKVQEMATDGETYQYLYNKEAGGFFAGGNDWNTRASVSTTADAVKFISLDGESYNFACYPSTKNKWLYVSCNNFDALWVDAPNNVANGNYPGTDAWQIQKLANGSYKISNSTIIGPYTLGVAEIYRGLKGNTRCYINDQEDVYEVDGETTPSISGKFYDEWVFVDEEEYEALKPQVEVYLAAVNLQRKIDAVKAEDGAFDLANINKVYQNTSSTVEELNAASTICDAAIAFHKALEEAKATYPYLDFSAPIAVYNNVNSTAEELTAASGQIKEIVNNYEYYKVETPSISYDNNKIIFSCGTENVEYHCDYSVTQKEATTIDSNGVFDIPTISSCDLTISVYATAIGLNRSKTVTKTFKNIPLFNNGDVNNDKQVNISDVSALINKLLNQK